jgi:hypothetical protein
MRFVYENAEQVLIWLGRGINETDNFMDFAVQAHRRTNLLGQWLKSEDMRVQQCRRSCGDISFEMTNTRDGVQHFKVSQSTPSLTGVWL